MRAVRAVLLLLGLVAVGYGAVLWWPQRFTTVPWLLAGPVLHDLLVAPAVGGTGWLLARLLPPRWRHRVAVGLAGTGTLLLLAVPLLLRPSPAAPNPGLQDRPYLPELAFFLALFWAVLLVTPARRRPRPPRG
jgi:hypothetical protein